MNLPSFAENILREFVSKCEADSEVHVDANRNVVKTGGDEDQVTLSIIDKVVDAMGVNVGSEESPEVKLGLMIKNAKVIKAVRLLEPLVEDLKKLTVDESIH